VNTLKDLKIGESAVIESVGGEGATRQHLLDMGMTPGTKVDVIQFAPLGDPVEIRVRGYELTLRLEDAGKIGVTKTVSEVDEKIGKSEKEAKHIAHPGLGEEGKFHPKGSGNPLPEGTTLTFALVGNQNSGKTTLFNQLTGSNQHVGNFPGVTVDRKDGAIKGHDDTMITDLPGIYSMSPYSSEELVSRDFVLEEKPKAIINIVDVTNIERNLYLTMQLLEMDVPVVVALNMMDELTGNGGGVYVNAMEEMLGTPVVPISAAKREGVDELVDHALHIAKYQEKPLKRDFCGKDDKGGAVHRAIHAVVHLIEDHAAKAEIPVRFAAAKIVEGDELIMEKLNLDQNEKEMIEHIVTQLEHEHGMDRSAAMADMRFSFIQKVCDRCITKPKESKEHVRSRRIDKILTGKWTAIPVFILVMGLVFFLTFNVVGAFFQWVLELGIDALTNLVDMGLTAAKVNVVLHDLIITGIFGGVGSVVSFLPIIVTMFFFLSILEDSGYIARVAFFMDKALRKLGLSGRSIVPLLIGFGCTVPAVMSTRTLPSERDRKMTILLTPFMSCTAKIPVYLFFVEAFVPKYKALVMCCLYILGIVVGLLIALVYKKIFKGEAVPFVMELPNYRMPSPKNVMQLLWEKAKDFLQRAFTVILVATIIVWFLQSFNFHFDLVENPEGSILASIAGLFVPIFKPLGLGDWRIVTSLFSGIMAKESVVSILEMSFTNEGGVNAILTFGSAFALLVFCLLYTPCVAAIASIRRELGTKWALFVIVWQSVVAWLCAMLVRLLLMAVGL
jgi:ferrous iron transport protein B